MLQFWLQFELQNENKLHLEFEHKVPLSDEPMFGSS